jgi:hypothetical protein
LQNRQRKRRIIEQTEEEKNCRTVRSRRDLQNIEEVVRIDLSMLLVIQSFIHNQGGREVLGRTVFLRGSSGCLNTGSCSFHLVATRETRVAGWCKGEHWFFVIQVCAYLTGSWCFHPVGAGTLRELVLPSSGC